MLWYKSFRELRTVMLVGLASLVLACVLIVLNERAMRLHADTPITYTAYIWKAVYGSVVRDIFVILTIILGSGGVLQERSSGTSNFTFALPVSRPHLIVSRAAIGYLGVIAFASVPVLVVSASSRYVNEQYPVSQNLQFFLLWAACGAVFYGLTFLLAHLLHAEYLPVLVAIGVLMLYGALFDLPWFSHLRMLNIFGFLNGSEMPFFDEGRHLLTGPMPWLPLAAMLMLGVSFVTLAARRVEPLDF